MTALHLPSPSGLLLLAPILVAGCADDDFIDALPPTGADSLDTIDYEDGDDEIVFIPGSVDRRIRVLFDRYTALEAPNGRRVHFLVQDDVPTRLLLRMRGIVEDMLADRPGTTLGADKAAVFNRLARSESTLVLFRDEDSFRSSNSNVSAFTNLFGPRTFTVDASAIVPEGSADYVSASPAIDVAIGDAARFVYRRGIRLVHDEFVDDLQTARADAITRNDFRPEDDLASGQFDEEYLALGIEVYYGLWGHDPNLAGFAGGATEYDYIDRADMQAGDPLLFALIEDWFAPTHDYETTLDPSFGGTFDMTFDAATPYTHRSRYLRRCDVRDLSTATLRGNELDNVFQGSPLASDFMGLGGDDEIDGSFGADRALYVGLPGDYTVTEVMPGVFEVVDTTPMRDGTDTLRNIQTLVFGDGSTVDL